MDKKETDVFSDEYIDSQVSDINNFLRDRNYARLSKMTSVNGEINRPRKVNRNTVRNALKDPVKNVDTLQEVSTLLRYTNGIYQNILRYGSNILTNDYMIAPKSIDKIKTKKKAEKSFMEAANYLKKFAIKKTCPWIYWRTIEQGELYTYKIEHENVFVIQEIPNWMCRIVGNYNGIFKYAINLQKLNDKTYLNMPDEIQKAYIKFKKDKKFKESLIEKCFYIVEGGVAFSLDQSSLKGVPIYANIFDDLMELEDMKDLKSENAIIESIKLIHQKIPFDKDTKKPAISVKEASAYHYSTKEHLPKGTSITTNPLDLQAITLSDNGNKLSNRVDEATDTAFSTAGINKELFNGSKNSNEAIAMGIIIDSLLPFELQRMVQGWLNYELNLNKSTSNWEVIFVGTTQVNQDNKIKTARENAISGMLRTPWIAASGFEPSQYDNLNKLEDILGIAETMIPQQTAHTISSSDTGRPSKEDTGEGSSSTPQAE